jgi:hypothetical protein
VSLTATADARCLMSRSPCSVAVSTRADELFEDYVKAKNKADSSGDHADGLTG